MAITPADIEQLTFSPSKHGYDTTEVDSFLEELAVEVDAMLQKIADLKGRLTTSDQALEAARNQIAALQATPAPAAAPEITAPQPSSAMMATERQISQALIVAQQSADRIVAEARDNADKIRTEADQKAREVIRQALAEKQNELDEIDRLKASREEFRTEYKNLLQHFMDDAEAVFPAQMLAVSTSGSAAPHYEMPELPAQTTYVPAPDAAPMPMDDLD